VARRLAKAAILMKTFWPSPTLEEIIYSQRKYLYLTGISQKIRDIQCFKIKSLGSTGERKSIICL